MKSVIFSLLLTLPALASPPSNPPTTSPPQPYHQKYSLHGISFTIDCANSTAKNTLTITPSGLKVSNTPITLSIDGSVTQAEIADLNQDGSPEIYIYTQSHGPNPKANLVAYAANRKKSLSEICLPNLLDDPKNSIGYNGNDQFAIVESSLCRRFPIENPSKPSEKNKTRQLQYKLTQGEASWLLKLHRSSEF